MNEDAVREKLAAALLFECGLTQSASQARAAAIALLPVVREIAAQELREAASALGAMPAQGVHVPTVGLVMAHLRDRADALSKPPDGPVR